MTGAALRMTWHHFLILASAVVYTDGLEKLQNALWVGGRQRCMQLSILEGSLAELLRF